MSTHKQAKTRKPAPAAPSLTPMPEHPSTPIRPEKFPSIRQTAMLAALISGSAPKTENEAREAARSALLLWRATRDEINEQREKASSYWKTIDENRAAMQTTQSSIKARLERLGISNLADQKRVSWQAAAKALFPSHTPKQRGSELSKIVVAHMAGQSCWRGWTLTDFKRWGFDSTLGFPSLVAIVDSIETDKETKATSAKFSAMGKKSAARRKWGKSA